MVDVLFGYTNNLFIVFISFDSCVLYKFYFFIVHNTESCEIKCDCIHIDGFKVNYMDISRILMNDSLNRLSLFSIQFIINKMSTKNINKYINPKTIQIKSHLHHLHHYCRYHQGQHFDHFCDYFYYYYFDYYLDYFSYLMPTFQPLTF